jgi:hypothetical protein
MKGTMIIPYQRFLNLLLWIFPYFSGEEGELEQLEKFNALKASKPEKCRSHGMEVIPEEGLF